MTTKMTRSELVAAAERRTGHRIKSGSMTYAIKCGYIRPASRRPDGWFWFDEQSLDDLTRYIEQRSRPRHGATA